MTQTAFTYVGGQIFDGVRLQTGKAARFRDGLLAEIVDQRDVSTAETVIDLEDAILSPGYVDLQVNGGDGILFNDDPSVETLTRIATAHRGLGALEILPTLITDTPEKKTADHVRTIAAEGRNVRGIAGLHLEGPHLSIARKGAHDPALIRPMEQTDLDLLLDASRHLPVLKVTVAPENVTPEQVRTMAEAGILVSLGHTDADFDTCRTYVRAGVRCVTHLFNAMSQLGNREPGLVGAVLAFGMLSAGLIADGVHVHPAVMRSAWKAKAEPGRLFLVSDAMAVAGSDHTEFTLGGRRITRQNGRLTLENGTLAGADLDLTAAVRVLHEDVGVPLEAALRAATTVPGEMIDAPNLLAPGVTHIDSLIRISGALGEATPLASGQPERLSMV